jgi:importin subunit beta-1
MSVLAWFSGSILEGPEPSALQGLVSAAFPVIIQHISDAHERVKDTAAWTVGKICEFCPETITEQLLPPLMQQLAVGLKGTPRVAHYICYAIHNLAGSLDVDDDTPTCLLSQYFPGMVQALLMTVDRGDADANLTLGAYEAINMLILRSAQDTKGMVEQLIPVAKEQLKATFAMPVGSLEQAQRQSQRQGLICGVLDSILHKIDASAIAPHADEIMTILLEILKSQHATVHEESLLVVSLMATKLEGAFQKYLAAFHPHLCRGLAAFQEANLCKVWLRWKLRLLIPHVALAFDSFVMCLPNLTSFLRGVVLCVSHASRWPWVWCPIWPGRLGRRCSPSAMT